MKKTKRQRVQFSYTTMIIFIFSVLIFLLIVLTIIFAVNNSKYRSVYATAMVGKDERGKREVVVTYVVKGEAFSQPFSRAPKKWKNDDLVRIEYHKDDHEDIRLTPSSAPIIFGYILGAAGLAGGISLHLRPKIRKTFEE